MAGNAAADRANNGMMAGVMPRDAADQRAFQAALGLRGGASGEQGDAKAAQDRAGDNNGFEGQRIILPKCAADVLAGSRVDGAGKVI